MYIDRNRSNEVKYIGTSSTLIPCPTLICSPSLFHPPVFFLNNTHIFNHCVPCSLRSQLCQLFENHSPMSNTIHTIGTKGVGTNYKYVWLHEQVRPLLLRLQYHGFLFLRLLQPETYMLLLFVPISIATVCLILPTPPVLNGKNALILIWHRVFVKGNGLRKPFL